ncbi:hypothetical protein HK097_007648 [Rhizophlyctis rosea]|uniref:Uncharacterized protein n=1 Tax=Rhizophlyctis rosea TaxID=64517 RepID=A0AAD5SDJ0_9FUNG|nr:hypothetical protein HK097_007648 [Rhizophlyctis rosea]
MAELLHHPNPATVHSLIFDNHKIASISQLLTPTAANGAAHSVHSLAEYVNVSHISLSNCGLTSLEGFPKLPNLQRLILTDNKIKNGLEALAAAGLDQLSFLDLSGNRVADYQVVSALKQLPNLKRIGLIQCPIADAADYQANIFATLPGLELVDDTDRDGNTVEEFDDDEGEEDEEDVDEYEEDEEEGGDEETDEAAVLTNQAGDVEEYSEDGEGDDGEYSEADQEEDLGDGEGDEEDAEGSEQEEEPPQEELEEFDEDEEEEEESEQPPAADDDSDEGEEDDEEAEEEFAGLPSHSHHTTGGKGLPSNHALYANLNNDDDEEEEGGYGGDSLLGDLLSAEPLGDDDQDLDFVPGPDLEDFDFIDEEEGDEAGGAGKRKREEEQDPLSMGMEEYLNGGNQLGDFDDGWLDGPGAKRQKS